MCGIPGLIRLDGGPVQPHLLSAMGGVTTHRGPEDEGMHFDGAAGADVVAGAELLVPGSSSRAVIDALMRLVLPAKVQGLCS